MMRIRNTTTGEIVATEVIVADGWRDRMLGLINRKRVEPREGIWFDECALIHTVGMQTRIDVVFLDKDRRVVRTLCAVPQNKLAVGCRGARSVIELGSGTLNQCDILIGDHLELEQ